MVSLSGDGSEPVGGLISVVRPPGDVGDLGSSPDVGGVFLVLLLRRSRKRCGECLLGKPGAGNANSRCADRK